MAIQAQMYPDNLGLPLLGGGVGGGVAQQDWLLLANNHMNNNNNTSVFNGCGFNEFTGNSNLQQQKQQQQFQYQQQQQQQQQALLQLQQQYLAQLQQQQQRDSCVRNINNDGFVFLSSSKNCTTTTTATTPTASTTTSGSCDYQMPMNFSPSFSDQLEKQRQEIDRFITLQNERLKMTLQEQRKQQLGSIMRKLESKAMQLLRQKDEEIARATKRTMDLEEIIRKMEIENQEWQRLATENEAMVLTLNNTLVQLKEQQAGCLTTTSSSCCSNEVDDAESCCNVADNSNNEFSNKKRKREETGVVVAETGEKREKTGEVLCKVCKTGKSCVLLLPCRHLCCCKGCEAFVDVCPVCKSVKMASIEALIS
ncbi:probable BOI-related E3 ubiquitin-protein ligase 2 [Chenopodium quinoa]|uniref:probable BOI-related E3 ubiquitin-protein ligase 2 n=1 Tax=Chenopodium quinoa TaxID=63459 RepID=UPI000B770091|nr:probable BOI-related E3 ubiquitin-protein ligase 2 [Chenopodium quinoa]